MTAVTDIGIDWWKGNGRVGFLLLDNVTCCVLDAIMLTESSGLREVSEWLLLGNVLGICDDYRIVLSSGEDYRLRKSGMGWLPA